MVFYLVYQFAQFLHADLLFLDKRGDGREVGVVEVVLDDASNRPAAVLRLGDEGVVLVSITKLFMIEESLTLQNADDRRERVEMRARLSIMLCNSRTNIGPYCQYSSMISFSLLVSFFIIVVFVVVNKSRRNQYLTAK